jgi:enamine deaminase RidA (YjgF/YER057c/UK114 family)
VHHEARLIELGIELPGPFPPHDPLDAIVVHSGRARTSGQLPRNHDGVLVNMGTLGDDVTVEQGAEAARWCALNAVSVLQAELGDLDRIERVLTVLGFVACAPGFLEQPAVRAAQKNNSQWGRGGVTGVSCAGVEPSARGSARLAAGVKRKHFQRLIEILWILQARIQKDGRFRAVLIKGEFAEELAGLFGGEDTMVAGQLEERELLVVERMRAKRFEHSIEVLLGELSPVASIGRLAFCFSGQC